ncbi:MAG: PH domain-containing protein [Bryobacteraceae bacterium]
MSALLLRLLRVPREPEAPDGTPESIRVFRAGRNYLRWRLAIWGLAQFGILLMVLFAFAAMWSVEPRMAPLARTMWRIGAGAVLAVLVVSAIFSYVMQRLNYELRWYIVTDRSLRIRSGIWSVEEITMTFANIQDLRLQRDPLQLALGLADLEVSSAGGGASSPGEKSSSHVARFSGVDDAEALRDLIVERLRRYRDAGLGDPDTHAPMDVEGAAAELLAEARALRAAVS